jgi:hypothetical protein
MTFFECKVNIIINDYPLFPLMFSGKIIYNKWRTDQEKYLINIEIRLTRILLVILFVIGIFSCETYMSYINNTICIKKDRTYKNVDKLEDGVIDNLPWICVLLWCLTSRYDILGNCYAIIRIRRKITMISKEVLNFYYRCINQFFL